MLCNEKYGLEDKMMIWGEKNDPEEVVIRNLQLQ